MTTTALPPVEREAERAARLQAMKRRATGLLVVMALVYLTLQVAAGDGAWVGYALAATEGSLVGGLADWFAVTALFRHPLNIPIPHTAVIRARKDQFGETLGEFVQGNFLSPEVVRMRLRSARVPERLALWLADPANARVAAAKASDALLALADAVNDEDVQRAIHDEIGRAVDRLPLTRMAAGALRTLTEENRHSEVVNAALVGLSKALSNNREELRARFSDEAPWWLPGAVEDRIFDRLLDGASAYLDEVSRTPAHEVRKTIDEWLHEMIERLETSPDLSERGDQLKRDLLNHPELRRWTGGIWGDFKTSLRGQAGEEESELRARVDAGQHVTLANLGAHIDRPALQHAGHLGRQLRLVARHDHRRRLAFGLQPDAVESGHGDRRSGRSIGDCRGCTDRLRSKRQHRRRHHGGAQGEHEARTKVLHSGIVPPHGKADVEVPVGTAPETAAFAELMRRPA